MYGLQQQPVCREKDHVKLAKYLSLVLQPKDTLPWGKGCAAGHHKRLKPAILVTGIQQVRDLATLPVSLPRPDLRSSFL